MKKRRRKNSFAQRRPAGAGLAKTLGVSFYPEHYDILARRSKELNIPSSILLQLLLEIERREGLLRPELISRFSDSPPPVTS